MIIVNTALCIKEGFVKNVNKPEVKENIKRIIGIATFIFGLIEVWSICRSDRAFLARKYASQNQLMNLANGACSVSIILSASVSKLGVALISNLSSRIFTKKQTEDLFGPNTIFAINPWHPRHTVSFVAMILASAGFFSTEAMTQKILLFNVVTSRPVLHRVNQGFQ